MAKRNDDEARRRRRGIAIAGIAFAFLVAAGFGLVYAVPALWGWIDGAWCRLTITQRDPSRHRLPIPNEVPLGESSPGIENPTKACDPSPTPAPRQGGSDPSPHPKAAP